MRPEFSITDDPAGRPRVYDRLVHRLYARLTGMSPRLQDLVLAVALAAVNVGTVLPVLSQILPPHQASAPLSPGANEALALALLVLQALPLIWRRTWPVTVLFVCGLPRSAYDQIGFGFAPVPLGPALAYYTVMERSSTRTRWIVTVLLLIGIAHSQTLPGHTEPYDFFVQLLIFGAVAMAGMASRARRAYLEGIKDRAVRAEAERDQQVALAAAQERSRIARELHDVVAHHVSLMAVQSEAAGSLLPGQPEAAARSVQIIGETARQALTELRRLLGVLRGPGQQPHTAPAPSLGELDEVLAQVRGAGLTVELSVEGAPEALAPGVDLAAYRIVQEALTNALRHSAASRAAVTVRYEPGYVMVSVTDPGPSPVPSRALARVPAELGGGFGLAGITERVASCGGTLTVGPTSAGGFAVTARLPAA
jgi:signal transduction histidine kinase